MARINLEATIPCGAGGFRALPVPEEQLTLLDLVAAVADHSRSEAEIVAVVRHMIESGRVVLVGQFRAPHLVAAAD